MKIVIYTVTERGRRLAEIIKDGLPSYNCFFTEIADEVFDNCDAIIYVCAVGIAVRKIAPFIKSKLTDPAVIVCDDAGKFVVSLLSGHLGGANALTEEVAAILGAVPVITTASEVNNLPKEPRNIVVGIGCRRGADADSIERAVTITLYNQEISIKRVCAIATVDTKRDEAGLLEFSQLYDLPLVFYTADELKNACGEFAGSDFVNETVGVDNVCERAAALCGGTDELVIKKTVKDGVTVAASLTRSV